MAKGLVSNSSRAQALSYRRYAPNPIGVTAIAAVNGKGAHAKAKRRHRRALEARGRRTGVIVRGKRVYGAAAVAAMKKRRMRHNPAAKKKHTRGGPHNVAVSFTTTGGQRVTITPRKRHAKKPKVVTRTRTRTVTRTVRSSKVKRASMSPLWVTKRGKKVRLVGAAARAWRERKGARLGGSSSTSYKTTYGKAKKALSPKKRHAKKHVAKKAHHHRRAGRIYGSPVVGVGPHDYVVVREMRRNGKKRKSPGSVRALNRRSGATTRRQQGARMAAATRRFNAEHPKWAAVWRHGEGDKLLRTSKGRAKLARIYKSEFGGSIRRDGEFADFYMKGRASRHKRRKSMLSSTKWRNATKAQRATWKRSGSPIHMLGRGTVTLERHGKQVRLAGAAAKAWAKKHLHGAKRSKFLKQVASRSQSPRRNGSMSMHENASSYTSNKKRAHAKKKGKGHKRVSQRVHVRPIYAKIGGKRVRTYMERGPGGKMRHIPTYRLLGYKSEKAMASAVGKSDKTASRIQRRLQAIRKKREQAATKMMRRGPRVHGKYVPPYRALGFKSQHAVAKILQGPDRKKAEALSRRLEALMKRRRHAAAKILKHGDAFTANVSRVPYEEWSTNAMEPNKKKRGKRKSKKGGGWTKAKRSAAAKKAARTRKRHHAARSAASRKGARKRKKGYRKNAGHFAANAGHFAANKRRAAKKGKKGKARRGKKHLTAAQKRKMRAGWLAWYKKKHGGKSYRRGAAKKKGKKGYRRNEAMVANRHFSANGRGMTANRRGRMSANRRGGMTANRRGRHHYRSNASGAFVGQLKEALKVGAIGTGGFLVHRGLSYFLSENLLTKIGVFQDATTVGNTSGGAGSMAQYRRIVAGAVTALVGVPLAEKIAPKQATPIAAGMVISFFQQLVVMALSQFQPTLVPAVSGYGDNPGRVMTRFRGGYGEYFQTPMGEYFRTGMGAYGGGIRQAAAGFGQPMFSQAAAGFGAMQQRRARISQAAAGFGQPPPMLSQAAAGVGEFFLAQPQGIGDYEQVGMPTQGAQTVTDDGIPGGDTRAAEHAISIAEAAAGIGTSDGIGVQSIVDPMGVAVPVNDEPGGARAGLFAGSEGIFG